MHLPCKLRTLIPIIGLVLVWEVLSRIPCLSSPLFPPFSVVLMKFIDLRFLHDLGLNYLYTLTRSLTGFTLGLVAGLGLGIAASARGLNDYIQPVATLFFAIPSVAWIPLLIVWIGMREYALPITASFLCSFPPVLYGSINAFRTVDKDEVEVALILGGTPRKVLKEVVLPQALLKVMPVIKAEAIMSWKTVFVTEMVALSSGLGYLAIVYSSTLEIASLLAVIGVLGLNTVFLIQFLDWVESLLASKWLGGGEAWLKLGYGP